MEVVPVSTYTQTCEECIKKESDYIVKTYKNWHFLCTDCANRLTDKMVKTIKEEN